MQEFDTRLGNSLVFHYNVNANGEYTTVKIDETKQISPLHYTIQLSQNPDDSKVFKVIDKNKNELHRVYNMDEINAESYYLNAEKGQVYFDSSKGAENVVISYDGQGYELIGASRVYDETDCIGSTIKQTLQDIINKGREYIKAIELLGGAIPVITRLENDIADGMELYANLENDIEVAVPLQASLHKDIQDANTFRIQFNKDVAEGKELYPKLHSDIAEGKALDTTLNTSMNNAKENINLIRSAGNPHFEILASDWITNTDTSSTLGYMKDIIHNLETQNIVINAFDITTGMEIFPNVKRIDNNTLRFFNDNNTDGIKVILSARYYDGGSDIGDEVKGARKTFETIGKRFDNIDSQLEENIINIVDIKSSLNTKVEKNNVSVSDINKNLGKLDQSYMTDEFLQQIVGNSPINSVPSDNSVTLNKLDTNTKSLFINLNKINCLVYCWNNVQPYFEVKDSYAYIKCSGIVIRNKNIEVSKNWDNIILDIDSAIVVTSPKGIENCIKLSIGYCLSYNISNNKFEVKLMTVFNGCDNILLAYNNGLKIIDGKLLELSYIKQINDIENKNIITDTNLNTINNINELWYEENLQLFSTSSPTKVYIKFTKITKRLPTLTTWKTWSDLKNDIDDVSRFVTYNNIYDCLYINGDESLILDKDWKIHIINKNNYNPSIHINLCFGAWGSPIGGILPHLYLCKNINNINKIPKIEEDINNINKNIEYPSYFEEEITDTINKIEGFKNISGNNGYVFAFLTDTHWGTNKKNSPSIVKKIMNECKIETLINGGDVVTGSGLIAKDEIIKDIFNERKSFDIINTLYVEGNHDSVYGITNNYDSNISKNEFFNIYHRNIKENIEYGDDGTYFYKDFKQQKIRLICLNTSDVNDQENKISIHKFSQTQLNWLKNTALKMNVGYDCVIITHVSPWDKTDCPWGDNTTFVANNNELIAILSDFKNKTNGFESYNGNICCVLSGHEHNDFIIKKSNIPFIITACDAFLKSTVSNGQYSPERTANTYSEQIIDFICINKQTKTIKCIRCGAGNDRITDYIS